MTCSVTLLGVKGGPAIRPGSSMPTSTLVQIEGQNILIDAGLGAARAVCNAGVALNAIDLIVVTHLHSDHYLELGPLLHTAWTAGLTQPIPIIGPRGLGEYWQHFQAAMAFDTELRIRDEGRVPLAPLADLREVSEGTVWDQNGITITAIRNHHPPIEDSFALRISSSDRSIVLSGDTAPFDGWTEFCTGCDLLVHEVMLLDGVEALIAGYADPDPLLKAHILRSHTTAQDVGRLATEAGVKKLALNHFVPSGVPGFGFEDFEAAVRETYAGPLYVGDDGLRIEV